MTQTRFVNANGLPDARQLSSARDLAILARAVMRDYPQYYGYFNLESQEFRGHTYLNHNPLHGLPGVDGMKTGYTNAAGYNLVASQVKDGHRLIAVMLGGSNKNQRREHVTELMQTGFDVIERREHGEPIQVAQNEFTKAMGMEEQQPYAMLASAANQQPMTDAELRDTLAGSEEANATDDSDDDVQRLSAKVTAPDVVKTLTQAQAPAPAPKPAVAAPAPSAPVAYASLKTTDDSSDDAPDDAAAAPVAKTHAPVLAAVSKKKSKKNPDAVWSIQVGAFKDKELASNWIRNIEHRFDEALADSRSQITRNDDGWYRSRFAELTKNQAHDACRAISAKRLDCMVIKPDEG